MAGNQHVAATQPTPALDLLPLAPPYKERAHLPYLLLFYGLMVATQVPARIGFSYGEQITYLGPVLLMLSSIIYYAQNRDAQAAQYVPGLLSRAQLPNTPENYELASQAFAQRKSPSDVATAAALLMMLCLALSFADVFWTRHSFSMGSWASAFESLVNLVLFVVLLGVAIFCGASVSCFTRGGPISFGELVDQASVSSLELAESDRNDVELVSVDVALENVHRRVETYTIESTLLSALSFSAFTAIIYSDLGPLESARWLADVNWVCSESGGPLCLPVLTGEQIAEHSMFITAAFLLACAVFFLSVLVTRLRFNEAFRYTEELLKTAQALNQKEESGPKALRPHLTQEIGRLIDRAKHGLADLRPMVLFMKVFRELGIMAFVGAIATCGMLFHWLIAVLIMALFGSALFFGYVDKLRRKSDFLPRLQNTIVHALHNPGRVTRAQ